MVIIINIKSVYRTDKSLIFTYNDEFKDYKIGNLK